MSIYKAYKHLLTESAFYSDDEQNRILQTAKYKLADISKIIPTIELGPDNQTKKYKDNLVIFKSWFSTVYKNICNSRYGTMDIKKEVDKMEFECYHAVVVWNKPYDEEPKHMPLPEDAKIIVQYVFAYILVFVLCNAGIDGFIEKYNVYKDHVPEYFPTDKQLMEMGISEQDLDIIKMSMV